MSIPRYYPIGSVTVGSGGAASISFSNIPQTYTDLIVKISGRTEYPGAATWDWAVCSFNGTSTTTNWSRIQLYGTGSAAASAGGAGSNEVAWLNSNNTTASTFGNAEFYIPNYAGSNNKSISADSVTENNATSALTIFNATLWANTAAITSITLTTGSNPSNKFMQHTTATLYGIKDS